MNHYTKELNEDQQLLAVATTFNKKTLNKSYMLKKYINRLKINHVYMEGGVIIAEFRGYSVALITIFDHRLALSNIIYCKSSEVFLVSTSTFYEIIERYFKEIYLAKSIYFLDFISNKKTAKNLPYHKIIFCLVLALVFLSFLSKDLMLLVNNIVYLMHSSFKLLLLFKSLSSKPHLFQSYDAFSNYPIYTILVPMYKEVAKFSKLLNAIENIDYPKNLLDVKIILESDDISMIREVSLYKLPSYIQIIKTPASLPRTKPKALNYAMNYVRGEYLVVYDAEDEPSADQLKEILTAFNNLPDEYICLQSNLNFYNANENILTRCFALEYAMWFNLILRGMNFLNLPMPLGGTSNHFKVSVIYELGLWDSYNVTEDADLGLKIYLAGYKSKIHASVTLEEAPVELGAWFYQRVRWIKGFLQTFLTHILLIRRANLRMNIILWGFIAFSVHSFLILPLLLLVSFYNLVGFYNYVEINIFISTAIVLLAAIFSMKNIPNIKKFNKIYWLLIIIIFPFYFLLHSAASYYAFWELAIKPFYWNKTTHGISKII